MLRLLSLILIPILAACAPERENAQIETKKAPKPAKAVAKIGDHTLAQTELDSLLALKLYDLEWAKYQLRRDALSKLVEQRIKSGIVKASDIQILITPPLPPRLEIDPTKQPHYGQNDASVNISIFCSYQSSHCARMQLVYEELLERYPQQLRFQFFDFPQAFHRHAEQASVAARCANEQGQFWRYHKGLLANYDQLSAELYERLATQVDLDLKPFKNCMSQPEHRDLVAENKLLSEAEGFNNVPVTLINGLYINGPRSLDTLRYFIDQELIRMGKEGHMASVDSTQPSQQKEAAQVPLSELPLRLESVLISSDQSKSVAAISHETKQYRQQYRQDDELMENVFVVLIQDDSVIIENNGSLEKLLLSSATSIAVSEAQQNGPEGGEMTEAAEAGDTSVQDNIVKTSAEAESFDQPPAGLEYTYRGVVKAKGEMPLSRSWLDAQLDQQDQLRSHFEKAEHEVEGVHVMRLTNIEEQDFYQTLGLKEGDVILRVNDEWVHEAQNNLFAKLEDESAVSVILMRRGLPVHLKYAIN